MYKYLVEFRVEGTRDFPLDMLRYDSCWPRNSDDAITIGQTLARDDLGVFGMKQVCLIRYCRTKNMPGVTNGRWASFGWNVVGLPKVTKLSD